MALRFNVGKQCYSSEKPYSGFDQQQSLTCDPNQLPSPSLQKLNYTIDKFVIRDQPTLQSSTNFQKRNLAFFQDIDADGKNAPFFGVAGMNIAGVVLTQSTGIADAVSTQTEITPEQLHTFLQRLQAASETANRTDREVFGRPILYLERLLQNPDHHQMVADIFQFRITQGRILRNGSIKTLADLINALDQFIKAKGELPYEIVQALNKMDDIRGIYENFYEVLKAALERGQVTLQDIPHLLANYQVARSARQTSSLPSFLSTYRPPSRNALPVAEPAPAPSSAQESADPVVYMRAMKIRGKIQNLTKHNQIIAKLLSHMDQHPEDTELQIARPMLERVHRILQMITNPDFQTSPTQAERDMVVRVFTELRDSMDDSLRFLMEETSTLPPEKYITLSRFLNEHYSSVDRNMNLSSLEESVAALFPKPATPIVQGAVTAPAPAPVAVAIQITTEAELNQLYNNLKAVSQLAQKDWLRFIIEDLDEIFNPATHQEVRRIYVALVEMLVDTNSLREMNGQIQVFFQRPQTAETTDIFLRSLSKFIARINNPVNPGSCWDHSVATFARNFPDRLSRGGYTTDALIELIEYLNVNEKNPFTRLKIIEFFFKGELNIPEYRDLLITLRAGAIQKPQVLPPSIQSVETSPTGATLGTTVSQEGAVTSSTVSEGGEVSSIGQKLAQGGETLSQASKISFWTYFGLVGNIAGVVIGIPATFYSAGLTVVDIFDPKVSWSEVAIEAGITVTTGAGTFYAVGGVLYTGIWYFLTGTVAVAGAPVAIGAGLFAAGGTLAYAKEGKRENHEAEDFHHSFFQNIPIEQKAKQLATLADKADDEVTNKTLGRLKKWNPELLNPENSETRALWRSNLRGEKGEKSFAQEMTNTVKGYWIGSKDDAVSLVVLAQLRGSEDELTYALNKVDPQSYEEFRQGVSGLKSFEDLKKNGLVSPSASIQPAKGADSSLLVCEVESVSVQNKS